jgi:hypothetical protein
VSSAALDAVDAAGALLRDAALWRALSLALERPRSGWHAELEQLSSEIDEAELGAVAQAARGAGEGFYLAFVGPGGPVSLREVAHRKRSDPGHLLSVLRAFYEAFAYAPAAEDPLDHLAVEAGFVGYLRLKQAYALARGDTAAAEVAAGAAAMFTSEHVAAVADAVARSLEAADAGYLALAARALAGRAGPPQPDLEGDWVPACREGASCEFACGGEATD